MLGINHFALVVLSSNPFVDNIKHRLVLNESGSDNSDKSHHGHTSIVDFGLLSKSGLKFRKNSIWFGVDGTLVSFSLIWVKKKGVREGERADGSKDSYAESMYVGNQNDGTLMSDGVLS